MQHRDTFDRHHQLKGTRVQKIADEHAGRVAERGIGGRVPAAKRRFVDDVVVQQGRGVDHFDHRGERVMMRCRDSRTPER